MEINILGSILETKSMDLGSTILRMDIAMKEHGTKVVGKVMVFIVFEMETENMVNGMVASLGNLYHHRLMLSLHQFRYLSFTFTYVVAFSL